MSIYEGSTIEQEYAHGRDQGYQQGESDIRAQLAGIIQDMLLVLRSDLQIATTRGTRAFNLGYMRGYREAVRTLNNGRWGA